MTWGLDGTIVGRLYDSDGTTLLNTVTTATPDTTYASGGIAFRGFDGSKQFDTVRTPRYSDFYKIEVPAGSGQQWLNLNVARPAAGDGEFVNLLNPKVRLYDGSSIPPGKPLGADGDSTISRDAQLGYPIPAAGGTYYVEVLASDSAAVSPSKGEYVLTSAVSDTAPTTAKIIVSNTSLTTTESASDPRHSQTVWVVLQRAAHGRRDDHRFVRRPDRGNGLGGVPLTFTHHATNWNQPQSFTVTGVDDLVADGDIPYTISLSASGYAQVDVQAVNLDDDTAAIVVTDVNGDLHRRQLGDDTRPAAHRDSSRSALNSQPTQNVTIAVQSPAPAEGLVSSAGQLSPSPPLPPGTIWLEFTPDTWDQPQTVTVTSVDDGFNDGRAKYAITVKAVDPNTVDPVDPVYLAARPQTVSVLDIDDDQPTNLIEGFESGNLNSYTLKGSTVSGMTVTAGAARDGGLGLRHDTNDAAWIVRTDTAVQVKPGQVFSTYVNWQGVPGSWSWAGFGFGAGRKGTYAIAMQANVGTFELYRMDGYTTGVSLAKAAQIWLPDHWYRMEVQWLSTTTGDNMIASLYDLDFSQTTVHENLLNTIRARDTTFTSGGIAFRAFGDPWYFDTVLRGATAPLVPLPSQSAGSSAVGAALWLEQADAGMSSAAQPNYTAPIAVIVQPRSPAQLIATDARRDNAQSPLPRGHKERLAVDVVYQELDADLLADEIVSLLVP